MKILVTGVGGQLGYDVCRRLTQLGIEHKGVDVQDFDLTNADAVMDAVRAYAPDAIIHCAAYTNVEKAESMPEVCADVNGMGHPEHGAGRPGGAGQADVHQHRLRF